MVPQGGRSVKKKCIEASKTDLTVCTHFHATQANIRTIIPDTVKTKILLYVPFKWRSKPAIIEYLIRRISQRSLLAMPCTLADLLCLRNNTSQSKRLKKTTKTRSSTRKARVGISHSPLDGPCPGRVDLRPRCDNPYSCRGGLSSRTPRSRYSGRSIRSPDW